MYLVNELNPLRGSVSNLGCLDAPTVCDKQKVGSARSSNLVMVESPSECFQLFSILILWLTQPIRAGTSQSAVGSSDRRSRLLTLLNAS